MKASLRRAAATALLVLALPGTARADFPVITAGEQPPLLTADGGIVDRIVALALAAEGIEARFAWLPVGRMLTLLDQDDLDFFIATSVMPVKEHPHVDLIETRCVLFYRKADRPGLSAAGLDDLAGKTVATVFHSPLTPLLEDAGIVVDEGPMETLFEKLALGRVDFVATADIGGLLAIHREFPGREEEFAFTDFAIRTVTAALYAKDSPAYRADLEALRRGLAAIKADGSLERLLREAFGPDAWRTVVVK